MFPKPTNPLNICIKKTCTILTLKYQIENSFGKDFTNQSQFQFMDYSGNVFVLKPTKVKNKNNKFLYLNCFSIACLCNITECILCTIYVGAVSIYIVLVLLFI